LKKYLILLIFILTQNENLFSQNKFISDKIIQYTNNISIAIVNNNKGQLEEASKYFKKANQILPIHYWDLMYVKNLIRKKFDKELFLICVHEECIQRGFSSSMGDTSFTRNLSAKDLRKIKKQVSIYETQYLVNTDKDIENQLTQIISLDQFARGSNIVYLYNCDSCLVHRRRLMHYIDSAYTKPAIENIAKQNKLTYRSFGSSYNSFILIIRHIANNHSKDTIQNRFWEEFVNRLVSEFIITPQYYANLTDYCFNFKIDENNQKRPMNTYGEFSYFKGKLEIDDPEKTDQRRAEIGLLPLWESSPKSNLPNNYIFWYESKSAKPKE